MSEEEKTKTKKIVEYMLSGYELAVEHYRKYGKFYGDRNKDNQLEKIK